MVYYCWGYLVWLVLMELMVNGVGWCWKFRFGFVSCYGSGLLVVIVVSVVDCFLFSDVLLIVCC